MIGKAAMERAHISMTAPPADLTVRVCYNDPALPETCENATSDILDRCPRRVGQPSRFPPRSAPLPPFPMRKPAIIFDFGNVVAFFDYQRAFDRIGRDLKREGSDLLTEARLGGFDDLLRRFERGRITADEFSIASCRILGASMPPREFAEAWAEIFWLNEAIIPTIRGLQGAGYRLVLGSNTNVLHADWFRREFLPILSSFDHLVLSYEVGHVKPSIEFYLACAEAAGAMPADCIFIDDLPENVDGARAAGLSGLLYERPESLVGDLRALGVDFSLSHE
ncbi:HAD family hydrolase [Tautonia plasticadhaerens]|uniref:HAD family hydrolase n=1 Tax=Tautonia plasticadhaerens TaxID=2527974 RepID=UPI001E376583|nr:HAD family phosphatase [Tautonia plasticadhaerens]